jgi:hypothetical protein
LSATANGVVGQETYKTLVECICERIGGVVGDKMAIHLSERGEAGDTQEVEDAQYSLFEADSPAKEHCHWG